MERRCKFGPKSKRPIGIARNFLKPINSFAKAYSLLLKKMKHRLFLIVGFVMVFPIILIIIGLRPLFVVRFKKLLVERLGNFAVEAEQYLVEKEEGFHRGRNIDIFYHNGKLANRQMYKMINRKLIFLPFPSFCRYMDLLVLLCKKMPDGSKHLIPVFEENRALYSLTTRRTNFSFTAKEEAYGLRELKKIGIPEGAKFICIYARDSAYLDKTFPEVDWSYHDVRDNNIQDYMVASEALVAEGYFVVRMGHIVKEPLRSKNPKIIDYATKGFRSDFLDVYLPAKCHFFLGVPGGIAVIPMLYRRPMAFVDIINLCNLYRWDHGEGIFVTKKVWLNDKKRFMTFKEMSRIIAQAEFVDLLKENKIRIDNCSPEEIMSVASELNERILGKWRTTDEDEKLQTNMRTLFKEQRKTNTYSKVRVGARFLKENRALMDC